MGERQADPAGVRPVIPDAEAAALAWSRRTGIRPVNHIVAVRTGLLREHPWLAGELTGLFERAWAAHGSDGAPQYGLEPNRRSMQMLLDFAADQGVTPRAYTVDEIFALP